MILESSKHFHDVASVTLEHKSSMMKAENPVRGGECINFIQRGDAMSAQKATPRKASIIKKTINGVLAGKRLGFVALEQTKPVLMVKQEPINRAQLKPNRLRKPCLLHAS